jgi:hypothetical protein
VPLTSYVEARAGRVLAQAIASVLVSPASNDGIVSPASNDGIASCVGPTLFFVGASLHLKAFRLIVPITYHIRR